MKFIPISPADYPQLKKHFVHQKYILSSYSLSGICAWNNCAFNNYFSVIDGGIAVMESHINNPAQRWLLLPVCPSAEKAPSDLVALVREAGVEEVRFVPNDYVARFGHELEKHFTVTRNDHYDDYIYSREDLSQLKGHKYSKKRNLIKQFEKEYVLAGRAEVRRIMPEDVPACRTFLDEWYEHNRLKFADWTDELGCEKNALLQTLENFNMLEVKGITVRLDGKISGLAVASHLTSDMGVLNFEKAFDAVKGLYQYLDMNSAAMLFDGCSFINKESALGDEGLMRAKHSYHPVQIAPCYTLRVR